MQSGTTQDSCHQRLYKQWSNFCATLNINPAIQDPSVPRAEVPQFYGHHVRHTQYSKRREERLGKESVSQAWGAIMATHRLDILPDPRKPNNPQANGGFGNLKPTPYPLNDEIGRASFNGYLSIH